MPTRTIIFFAGVVYIKNDDHRRCWPEQRSCFVHIQKIVEKTVDVVCQ